MPMAPYPLDQGLEPGERPDPRRWQYPVGYNLPIGVPGSEGFKLASFQNLRAYADLYSVARACLNVRQNEILGLDWDITPTDDAAAAMRGNETMAADFQKRVREAIAFMRNPDPSGYNGYHGWLRAILEDLFVVDAVALYLHPPRLRGYGVLGSDVAALEFIDGTTIKPLIDLAGGRPKPPNPAFHQYLYGVPRREFIDVVNPGDLDEETAADEDEIARYRADQLIYLRYQPRSFSPYGFSLIEQCILPIAIGVKGQQYTFDFFTEGSIPDTYVMDGRSNSTVQQSRQLQDQLNATAMDSGYRRKIVVLPFNSKAQQMKPQALTAGIAQEYAELVCMVLDVAPHEIGLGPSKGGGLGGKGFTDQQENSLLRKSLIPALTWLKRELFDPVLQVKLGQADMEWHWKGFEPAEDQATTTTTLLTRRNAGELSTDEMRVLQGKDPWGTPYTSKPYYYTPTGIISLEDGSVIAVSGGTAGAAEDVIKAAEEAAKQPPPPQLAPGRTVQPAQPGTPAAPAGKGPEGETTLSEAGDQIDHSEPVPEPKAKGAAAERGKDVTLSAPLATGFVPYGLAGEPDEDERRRRRLRAEHEKAHAPGEPRTGAMIALVPPPATAAVVWSAVHLALPAGVSGEPATELHVTLEFLGKAAALSPAQRTAILTTVGTLAAETMAIPAELTGAGEFVPGPGSDGAVPWIGLISGARLQRFRADLDTGLRAVVADVLGEPDEADRYLPHMTFAYLAADAPLPRWQLPALPLAFGAILVAFGDEQHTFPLLPPEPPEPPEPPGPTKGLDPDGAERFHLDLKHDLGQTTLAEEQRRAQLSGEPSFRDYFDAAYRDAGRWTVAPRPDGTGEAAKSMRAALGELEDLQAFVRHGTHKRRAFHAAVLAPAWVTALYGASPAVFRHAAEQIKAAGDASATDAAATRIVADLERDAGQIDGLRELVTAYRAGRLTLAQLAEQGAALADDHYGDRLDEAEEGSRQSHHVLGAGAALGALAGLAVLSGRSPEHAAESAVTYAVGAAAAEYGAPVSRGVDRAVGDLNDRLAELRQRNADGEISDAQLAAWTQSAIGSFTWTRYQERRADEAAAAGMTTETFVLTPGVLHCDPCIARAEGSPYPIGTNPPPGSGDMDCTYYDQCDVHYSTDEDQGGDSGTEDGDTGDEG